MRLYAAGGIIRDLLLGRTVQDADFVFDLPEDEFLQRNPDARKTKSGPFPVYFLGGQEYTPLNPPALQEKTSLSPQKANLLGRDFTINALLLSDCGILYTLPNTLADLRAGIIRPASDASLAHDPVRAYRAARFYAVLSGFSLHEETVSAMRTLREADLQTIAAEQVAKETLKALAGCRPGNFLRGLALGQCLLPWFVEYAEADAVVAGPPGRHSGSVLEHTAEVMDTVAQEAGALGVKERSLAVWMALCHDIGKTATPKEVLPRHLGHEERGVAMAQSLGLRLKMPMRYVRAGMLAAGKHMTGGRYAELRPGTRVDLLTLLHAADMVRPFSLLCAADTQNSRLPDLIHQDLARILAVRLPENWRNCGEQSGRQLRELRCAALRKAPQEHGQGGQ